MPSTSRTFTRKEAFAYIRKQPAKTQFRITAQIDLPIAGEPSKVFPGFASIEVSRKSMIDFIDNVLSQTLEDRGARIELECYTSDTPYADGTVYRSIYLM